MKVTLQTVWSLGFLQVWHKTQVLLMLCPWNDLKSEDHTLRENNRNKTNSSSQKRLSIWERDKKKTNETWRTQNKLKSWGILSWIGSVLRWAFSCDHFGLGLIPDKSLRSLKFQQNSMHAAQGECWKHHMSKVSTRPCISPLFCLVEVRDYLHFNI